MCFKGYLSTMLQNAFLFLRVMLALQLAFGTAAGDLCRDTWTYHPDTGTCIKVFQQKQYFDRAKASCIRERGGPSADQPGRLVVIQDSAMDIFVRELLSDDQKAYIGLVKKDNVFVWIDGNHDSPTYRGWKDGKPEEGTVYTYDKATITRNGWKSSRDFKRPYVCQTYAAFPPPTLTCPPSEEGKRWSPIECTVSGQKSYGDFDQTNVNGYGKSPAIVCFDNLECTPVVKYLSGKVSKDSDEKTLKTSVESNQLSTRSDDKLRWTCNYRFQNIPQSFLTATCTTHTFVSPQSLSCSYALGVSIVCDVRGVYPKASSTWVHSIDGDTVLAMTPQVKHTSYYKQEDLLMYNAEFTGQITDEAYTKPGQHTIEITVYPDVPFHNEENRLKASQKETISFAISVPGESPVFSTDISLGITENRLTVNEGQTITLMCNVNGGTPPVSSIVIRCDSEVRDSSGKSVWSHEGKQVRVELIITHTMDQKVCTCSAKHVSNQYNKQTSLTLNVLHVARIDSFDVNGHAGGQREVNKDARVELRCSAYGNPTPHLHIYQSYSDGRTARILDYTLSTSLSSTIDHATCETSGTYVCAANNSLSTETSEHRVDIKVRCEPQSCYESYTEREFSVVAGREAVVNLCVFAYPKPHHDIRIKPAKKTNFNGNLYSTKFIYTNNVKTKGYVQINMSSSITKHGNYSVVLNHKKWYYIDFSLVPFQPPSCPESLTITLVGSSFVTLSWVPAPDRGISQIFTVSQIDSEGVVVSEDVEDVGETLILHNATELDPLSVYTFKLSVRNDEGTTLCPHLLKNVTTQASPASADASAAVVVGVAVVVIIIAIVLVAVFLLVLVRRKRGKRLSAGSSCLPCIDNRDENIGKKQVKTEHIGENAGSTDLVSGDVYATVNKPKKKAVTKEDSVYTNNAVIQTQTEHIEKQLSNQPASSSENDNFDSPGTLPSISDSRNKNHPDSGGDLAQVNVEVYANSAVSYTNSKHSAGQDKHETSNSSKAKSGDTKKQEGKSHKSQKPPKKDHKAKKKTSAEKETKELVYMDVEFVPTQGERRVQPQEQDEPVDYACLDFQNSNKGSEQV